LFSLAQSAGTDIVVAYNKKFAIQEIEGDVGVYDSSHLHNSKNHQ
jgi:hypothetical protein